MLNIDNPVFKILTRVFDVMLLNILWFICSIPIITLGASTTALYYSMMKIIRKKDDSITRIFFHSFVNNLKQGSILTVILGTVGVLLWYVMQKCGAFSGEASIAMMTLIIVLIIILEIIISYSFPLLAQFENTTKNTVINAFVIGVSNLPYTSVFAFLNSVPLLLILILPETFLLLLPFWLLFGVALIALVNSRKFVVIFDKYIQDEKS